MTALFAPVITSFSPNSGVIGDRVTDATVLTLNGTGTAGLTIDIYDGSNLLGTTVANGSGGWSFTTGTLTSGAYRFTAKATNGSGGVSAGSSAFVVTVDAQAPATPIIASDTVNKNRVTITGAAEGNSTIEVHDGAKLLGTATTNSTGAWNYVTASALASGSHSFTATATDAAGNVSTTSRALNVTLTSPTVTVSGQTLAQGVGVSNNVTDTGIVTLTGAMTGAPGSTVAIYNGATQLGLAKLSANGAWSYITKLPVGTYALHAVVTDPANNTASSAVEPTFIVDSAPTVTSITATPSDAGQVITLTLNMSEAVTVNGAPTLTLIDGSAAAYMNHGNTATYVSGSSTSTSLVFTYNVSVGENTTMLTIQGVNLPSGASITNSLGSAAVLTGSATVPVLTINTVGGTGGTTNETIQGGTFAIGVNLDGLELNQVAVPSLSELQYYKSQGQDLIRLPITWQALQPTLNGPLDASYLADIESVVNNAASLGMKVILDMHDFGGTSVNPNGNPQTKIGSAGLTDADFANVWTRLAAAFAGNPGVGGYDLMNEPNTMPTATAWQDAAQAAITGIRTVDTSTAIYVEGNNWSTASTWAQANVGLASLKDPSNNLIFSAHLYLNANNRANPYDWAQQAANGVTTQTGVELASNFVSWLQANNLKGEIGEIGVGNDNPAWLTALDNTLAYAKTNNLQVTYFAGGPSWGDYPYSVEPNNGITAPQMAVLDKYSGNYPTVTVAQVSGAADPNATVYLSENDELLATTTANAAGSWSYTFTNLSDGVHIIVAGESLPTVDGTMAATVFNLAPTVAAAAVVTAVTASSPTATEGVGQVINLTVTMNEAITVTGGAPTLTLNDGGVAAYAGGSGTDALTFDYTVAAGQNADALTVTAVNLNGAAITDTAGDAANLSLTGITQSGPSIDTTAPAAPLILGDTVNGDAVTLSGTAEAGSIITVYDGATDLGVATTNSSGAWTYTTGALSDGSQVFIATATDAAGNVSLPSLALDPTISAPVLTAILATPAKSDLGVGEKVTFALTANDVLMVSGGAPTLSLNDNGVAVYFGGSGTNTLTFSYTVVAGQNTSSLAVTAVNLRGASIVNGVGAAVDLSLAGLFQSGPEIDTTPMTVTIGSVGGNVPSRRQEITGAVDAADAGLAVSLFNGTQAIGTVTSNATTGAWSAGVTLATGANSITARVVHTGGASATSNAVVFDWAPMSVATYLANPSAADKLLGGVYIADTAANVSASVDTLAADPYIRSITLSDNGTLTLTTAQAFGDGNLLSKFGSKPNVAVADAAANLSLLTPAQIAALATEGVTLLDATDEIVSLSLAQRQALGAANIELQEPAPTGVSELLTFNSTGTVTSVTYSGVTGAAYTSYTVYYGANWQALSASYSNGMIKTWSYNSDGSYVVSVTGVTGRPYNSYSVDLSADKQILSASFSNGMTQTYAYNTDGSYMISSNGVTGAAFTSSAIYYGSNGNPISASYSNGMTESWTYNSDGSYESTCANIPGSAYSSYENLYNASGSDVVIAESTANQSGYAILYGDDLVINVGSNQFNVSDGADTFILGNATNQTIDAKGVNSETFEFTANFGQDLVKGLVPSGATHDVMQFSASMFSYLSVTMSQTADASALLSHAQQVGTSVTITDSASDMLTLTNTTIATLTANPGVFRFV